AQQHDMVSAAVDQVPRPVLSGGEKRLKALRRQQQQRVRVERHDDRRLSPLAQCPHERRVAQVNAVEVADCHRPAAALRRRHLVPVQSMQCHCGYLTGRTCGCYGEPCPLGRGWFIQALGAITPALTGEVRPEVPMTLALYFAGGLMLLIASSNLFARRM